MLSYVIRHNNTRIKAATKSKKRGEIPTEFGRLFAHADGTAYLSLCLEQYMYMLAVKSDGRILCLD